MGRAKVDVRVDMAREGHTLTRVEGGRVYFTDKDGQEGSFDKAATEQVYLEKAKAQGFDSARYIYNSPDTALPISVATPGERAAVSLGNVNGNLRYLKQHYEDAQFQPESKSYVVKKGGVWHQVDPDGAGVVADLGAMATVGLGAFLAGAALPAVLAAGGAAAVGYAMLQNKGTLADRAKEVVGDVADSVHSGFRVAGQIGGTVAGAATGVPGANLVGAGMGSALAEGASRILGTELGTYAATPTEQLHDLGWAMVEGIGSEAVGQGLIGSASAVSQWAKRMAPSTGEAFVNMAAAATNKKPATIRKLFENPQKLVGNMIRLVKGNSYQVDGAMNGAAKDAIGATADLINSADAKMQGEYAANGATLVASAAKSSADLSSPRMAARAMEKLVKGTSEGQIFGKLGSDGEFIPAAIEDMPTMGQGAQVASKDGQGLIKGIYGFLQQASKQPQANPAETANQLLAYVRQLNGLSRNVENSGDELVVRRAINAIKESVSEEMEGAGLSGEYGNVMKPYEDMGNHVRFGRKYLGDNAAEDAASGGNARLEALASSLAQDGGKSVLPKESIKAMADYTGEPGAMLLDKLETSHATLELLDGWKSRYMANLVKNGSEIKDWGSTALRYGRPAVASAQMGEEDQTESDPGGGLHGLLSEEAQNALRYIPYVKQGVDFLHDLPPSQRATFLQHPQAGTDFIKTIVNAPDQEDAATNQLVNSAVDHALNKSAAATAPSPQQQQSQQGSAAPQYGGNSTVEVQQPMQVTPRPGFQGGQQ